MTGFRVVTDLDECQAIWMAVTPSEFITDLWAVRECFHRHYRNEPYFIVAENDKGINGLLPLSRVEKPQCYHYFPGETWHGKTWLEQNRIFSRDGVFAELLAHCPSVYRLNYLLPEQHLAEAGAVVDELGYLFHPPRYEYNIENFYEEFSRKSSKRMKRDIESIEELGVTYRYNNLADFEYIADLSIKRFGEDSYFSDKRFRDSFRSLMHYFNENEMLRITTVIINNILAAVDVGCIYRGTYTLLAGGTHWAFPGVAKLINMHHMKYACEQKLKTVDFLCGDFSWKKLFHLTPRPLHVLSNMSAQPCRSETNVTENAIFA